MLREVAEAHIIMCRSFINPAVKTTSKLVDFWSSYRKKI